MSNVIKSESTPAVAPFEEHVVSSIQANAIGSGVVSHYRVHDAAWGGGWDWTFEQHEMDELLKACGIYEDADMGALIGRKFRCEVVRAQLEINEIGTLKEGLKAIKVGPARGHMAVWLKFLPYEGPEYVSKSEVETEKVEEKPDA